jgi:hypothetical protein
LLLETTHSLRNIIDGWINDTERLLDNPKPERIIVFVIKGKPGSWPFHLAQPGAQ